VRRAKLALFGMAAAALALIAAAAPAAAVSGDVLFHVTDPRIDEASGLARGIASPGVFYAQNDSGDSARFFAIDATTGTVRAVYNVPGAQNHDWEDIAVARDAHGTPSVWLGDIGDNGNNRSEVQIYRVDEPHVDMSRANVTAQTATPDVWRLRYPSGPANAESLAVATGGQAYVITKSSTGDSEMYAVPPRPDPNRVQTMRLVGPITFRAHPGFLPGWAQMSATGAALSPDGSLLVIRTYSDAYLWQVHDGDVAAALRTQPTRLPLPGQHQGEGIGIDGRTLLINSEGTDMPVYRVPLSASTSPTTSPTSSAPRTSPSPTRTVTHAATADETSDDTTPIVVGSVAGAVVIALVVVFVWRRRRA
jgi:hypothetical protein